MTIESATDITDEIFKYAQKLFLDFWKGQPLRLVGVSLTGLNDGMYEKMSMFEDTKDKEKRRKLDAALDDIRAKYGKDAVKRGSFV